MTIEELLTNYKGKTFSEHKDALEWLRKNIYKYGEQEYKRAIKDIRDETDKWLKNYDRQQRQNKRNTLINNYSAKYI